ncbi:DUF4382 domain-containing protein [Psychroserpens sp. Hel_I_66]|uniref:DUF4382 domain-containing protein n=1 Tax=Psychroserpens sp. Hel_I_66 TaxID=1250004 RepID=UPI0006467B44|nr:DUF4382 domain-containing protein [Psychroserpens sp. Hel_I_66]
MKASRTFKIIVIGVLTLFLMTSCSNELETETFENSSLITVKIQGTPSILSKVNLEIIDVQLRVLEDETSPNAWVSLHTVNTGIHDLTKINTNDVVTLVDFEEIPSQFIYNIKLVFGDQNSVLKNGLEYTLNINENFNNAATNIVGKQLQTNKMYDFVLVLDLDNSIEMSSEENANLSPKMSTEMRLYNLF